MKKSTLLLANIICGSVMLVGCTASNSPMEMSKSLNKNLSILTNTINKLDTIDNSYLSNPDIYPIAQTNAKPAPDSNHQLIASVFGSNYKIDIPVGRYQTKLMFPKLGINNNIDSYKVDQGYYNKTPIKYSPRYNIDYNDNELYLDNYINKVRNLYAITNDAIVANNTLNNYKINILDYVVEIKELNSSIEDGTFTPSNQQIAALNNYIYDIKSTIKRIRNCNGDLSNEVNIINKTDVDGITTGIDVINSNYLSVLNHLDIRITYLKNALTTLEQIKDILLDIENIIENPNINSDNENTDDINLDNNNNEINSNLINDNNSNLDDNLSDNTTDNILDTNIENSDNNTIGDDNETNINEDIDINVNNDFDIDENLDPDFTLKEDEDTNSDTLSDNQDSDEQNNTNTENNNLDNEDNTITDTNDNNEVSNDEGENINSEEKDKTLLDTYVNTNNNLDTYKNDNNNIEEDINSENINNNENNETNNNLNNFDTDNNLINNNNANLNTPIANNGVGLNNGVGINNQNNMIPLPNDSDRINAPNRTFQNGIITQNNLNNGVNNGVNGNQTGYGSSNNYPYVDGDINRTNNNVNTYGYNTMIDMLNRGTVNNGINTLSITEKVNGNNVESVTLNETTKPSMVNTEVDENICQDCDNESNNNLNKTSNEENNDTSINNYNDNNLENNEQKTDNDNIRTLEYIEGTINIDNESIVETQSSDAINSNINQEDEYKAELL